ncbi:MAG: DUF4438 domain-containing protein [Trueperaceae bacterium]
MIRTNEDQLVELAIAGSISPPAFKRGPFLPDNDGLSVVRPGMFGYVYNVRVGDPAFGWQGDHVEPGASIDHDDGGVHHALHYLTCMGNKAVVTSGLAAGAEGVVVGEHARILIDFDPEVHEQLCVGDTIQIRAKGRGLKLLDHPTIDLKKLSPEVIHAMNLETAANGKLRVPVAMELPVRVMASGAELNSEYVDQDITSGDRALMQEEGLDALRLGDIVVIHDADHYWGRGYRKGYVAICLCIHGDSVMTGHGPGILTIMAGTEDDIEWTVDPGANLARYLKIREDL